MFVIGPGRLVVTFLLAFCVHALAQDAKVVSLAQAIAKAEGFGVRGALPTRYHNPGDLKVEVAGQRYPGQCGIGTGSHVRFCSDRAGWIALYHQLDRVAVGESKHYTPDMTLAQFAKKYARDWRHWVKNVARNLNVSTTTTLAEYLELPPVMTYRFEPVPPMIVAINGDVESK